MELGDGLVHWVAHVQTSAVRTFCGHSLVEQTKHWEYLLHDERPSNCIECTAVLHLVAAGMNPRKARGWLRGIR